MHIRKNMAAACNNVWKKTRQFQRKISKRLKKIPVIRICLLHWHSLTICLRHIVASVFTKFQALPTKTYNISRVFWV